MHIRDLFTQQPSTFSFEFFPPKTADGFDTLFAEMAEFQTLAPSFVSVTYGAGGSTRKATHDLVVRLKTQTPLDPIPHLTCVCHTRAEIHEILSRYAQHGISNIMALRGDPPKDRAASSGGDAIPFASDLVALIREFNESASHPDPRGFGIGVAGFPEGHPGTPNRLLELDHLKAKVDAGADFIVTQLFFDNRDFFDFRERCDLAGIRVPVIAGIMPITSAGGMRRMAELALGARYPAALLRSVNRAVAGGAGDDAVRRVGVHWATEQCRDLLDRGVSGIHFYTLNRSTATRDIYNTLGVKNSHGLR
ncbi:MAG: methylenetetrahydrofolate reductase [NAD(P)H] [Phycisphaerae bacterium]|nr:methylenetetrahydrofolate reductase [NAD(P)H] [Phycisphaerae bacterium]